MLDNLAVKHRLDVKHEQNSHAVYFNGITLCYLVW